MKAKGQDKHIRGHNYCRDISKDTLQEQEDIHTAWEDSTADASCKCNLFLFSSGLSFTGICLFDPLCKALIRASTPVTVFVTDIHRIHKWRTRGKKLGPNHESEELEGKHKIANEDFQ